MEEGRTESSDTDPPASGLRIFLNYRREDTRGDAGRLYDDLVEHFGEHRVFRDIDALHGGQDFDVAIEEAVKSCDVVIALIGRQWLTAVDSGGRRRIDNPYDFVRLELKAALEGNVAIVPLRVEGAEMPRSDELPPELARFAKKHALEISDSRWRHDRDRLIRDLERIQQERGRAPRGETVTAEREEAEAGVERGRREKAAAGGLRWRIVARWPVGLLVAAVVASITAGTLVLVAHGGSGTQTGGSATQTARAGALSVPYRSPWRVTTRAVPGSFVLERPATPGGEPSVVTLATRDATLTFGVVARSNFVPAGEPPALVSRFGTPQATALATVAGARGIRYDWNTDGLKAAVYVLATTDGDLAMICAGAGAAARGVNSCAQLVAHSRVRGVVVMPPGPDAVTPRTLGKAAAAIASAREGAGAIGQGSLAQRAEAARAVARSYDAVIAKLSSTTVPGRYRATVTQFVTALGSESDGFKLLAAAIQNRQAATYRSAAGSIVAAESSLARSVGTMRAALILIPPVRQLKIPAFPGG